jgi:two-component system LytT family sensor kinase
MKITRIVRYRYILLFWMVITLVHSLQTYVYNAGLGSDCSLLTYIGYFLPEYALWTLYTLVIFRLTRLFPVNAGNWTKPVAVHLISSVGITLFHVLVIVSFRWAYYTITGSTEIIESYTDYVKVNSLSNFFLPFILYFSTAVIGYALDYYNKYRIMELERVELDNLLIGLRLESIKKTLHPHFLFNTLNTISMLVRRKNTQQAIDMIAGLGDLLRYMLVNRENNWTTLGKEIEITRLFLEIEQIRFQNRLIYNIDVQEELFGIAIPDLLLQPLVENALIHGLKDKTENGQISIVTSSANNNISLTVSDNGRGFDTGHLIEGFGLGSTRERLEKLYNGKARLEIESDEDKGTRVKMLLPIVHEQ